MKVQQFRLIHYKPDGQEYLITWLECDKRLQKNATITLKEYPDLDWVILDRYPTVQDMEDVKKDWDNNHRREASDRNVVSKIK